MGTFGSTTQSVQITTNAQGRITAISNQEISGIPTGSVGPAELQSTAVTPGTCGSATESCIVTTDQDGRITNQTPVTITTPSSDPDPFLTSLRYDSVIETTTCDMTKSSHKITPTGTTTCTLPAATDTTKPGIYIIDVMNANSVVMAVTGADLLNGVNGSMTAVQGPLSTIKCHNNDDTANWRCSVTSLAGYGTPMTTLCVGTAGGTNAASTGAGAYVEHTLECALPSGKLTTNTVLKTCGLWRFSTDATPPVFSMRFLANDTVLNSVINLTPAASLTNRVQEICAKTIVTEAPSTTSGFITAPTGTMNAWGTGGLSGGATQPVDINSTGIVTITLATQWTTLDTATNAAELLAMTVEGSGLLP